MAITYGVTPEGFVRKPQSVILDEINASQKADLGEEWDTSPESPMGQVNGINARMFGLHWELLETAYGAYDPDKAEDFLLIGLAKLTGTEQKQAEYATVDLSVNLDDGTILESGTHFVEHETDATIRVTPLEDYEASGGGVRVVAFRAETKGDITAGTNTLNVIATPVSGWNSANNPLDDLGGGRELAEDPEIRTDREAQIANAAGATVEGIASELRELTGVIAVLPFENTSASTDVNGLPPNSFEMVVWDGESPAVANNKIAQTIWSKKGSGGRSAGTVSGTVTDGNGDEQVVYFSRSEQIAIYVEYDLEVGDDFDDDDFKLGVVNEANDTFTGGKDVLASRLIAFAWNQENVENVLAVRVGIIASPTLDDDIPMGIRQIARFATGRIDVTIPP